VTPGARLAAAAEVLAEIFARKAAADRALAVWGRGHRFAGSKDRAAIAERVYTCLRRRNECAFAMGDESPRALVLGSLTVVDNLKPLEVEALCADGAHALGALTAGERERVEAPRRSNDPWITLNYPVWLHDELSKALGGGLERELTALNARAPLDLRVNTLKARLDRVLDELVAAGFAPVLCPQTPTAIRLAAGADAKVTALPAYRDGRIEVQDEASQRAALIAGARPGDMVIDLAAGAGGKALALAAVMQNKGRILACDIEPGRLRNMEPRIARAGATIIEIVGDPYGGAISAAAGAGADLVFVDAPCSSTGTWRRNPEAKWTLDVERLNAYRTAQAKLLDRAAELVKPGGRIAYAVCSILPSEGDGQVQAFAARRAGWRVVAAQTLTPGRDGMDGFFVALVERPRR
jgi:16S rRNA (cytosine967-C5)-methyltransferase